MNSDKRTENMGKDEKPSLKSKCSMVTLVSENHGSNSMRQWLLGLYFLVCKRGKIKPILWSTEIGR